MALTKQQRALVNNSPALTALYDVLLGDGGTKMTKSQRRRRNQRVNMKIALEGAVSGTGISPGSVKPPGGGDDGISWKALGTNILNSLTVPGAVVTTSLANTVRGLSGQDLVSWKNMAGTFRGDKFAGGKGLLESFGIDDPNILRWGGLATDVLLDPTWALAVVPGAGQGYAGAKIAATGKRLANMEKFLKDVEQAHQGIRGAGKGAEDIAKRLADEMRAGGEVATLAPKALRDLRAVLPKLETAEAKRLSLGRMPYLHVGIPFKRSGGITIPLVGKAKGAKGVEEMLAKVQNRPFSLSPANKIAQDLRRHIRAIEDIDSIGLQDLGMRLGLTGMQSADVVAVASATQAGKSKGAKLREELLGRGEWTDEMDQALKVMAERGAIQAEDMGLVTYAQQGERAKAAIDDLVGPIADWHGAAVRRINKALQLKARRVEQKADQVFDDGQAAIPAALREERERLTNAMNSAARDVAHAEDALRILDDQIAHYNPANFPRKSRARKGEQVGGPSPKQAARERRNSYMAERKVMAQRVTNAKRVHRQATARFEKFAMNQASMEAKAHRRLADLRMKTKQEGMEEALAVMSHQMAQVDARLQALVDKAVMGDFAAIAARENLTEFFTRGAHTVVRDKNGKWSWRPADKAKKDRVTLGSAEEVLGKAEALSERGPYMPSVVSRGTQEEVQEFVTARRLRGEMGDRPMGKRDVADIESDKMRQFETPVSIMTKATFLDEMAKLGVPEEAALYRAERLDELLGFADKPTQWSGIDEVLLRPELDVFRAASERGRYQAVSQLESQMSRMADEVVRALYGSKDKAAQQKLAADMLADLQAVQRVGGSSASMLKALGTIRKKGHEAYGTARFQYWTAWLKAWFTVMNPGHYVANAVGQFMNNLIMMNPVAAARGLKGAVPGLKRTDGPDWRHLAYFGTKHDPKTGRMVEGVDREYLDRTFKVGKREMTGWELAIGARLSGLGMGWTQTEIQTFMNLMSTTKRTQRVRNAMQRFNMRREDAMRMATWIEHVRKGDDFFTAASKTIRTHFDYDALTDVERIWMRNLMLFYTWFKNNMVLQGYGLATRPGLYSTLAHYENSRPKFENEPTWWARAGGVYTPLGLVTWGNPLAEINKWDADADSLRQLVLGGGNPIFRAPIEVLANRNMFTGGEISKFEGQNVPHWSATLLHDMGVPGVPVSKNRATDEAPRGAWPASISHMIGAFTGPQGGMLGIATDPEAEGHPMLTVASKLSGLRLQPNSPEKFAASAQARETAKKSARTRKRNYEGANAR